MRSSLLCLAILAVVAISCKEEQQQGFTIRFATAPPVIDHSTPDRLIQSVWKYSAWLYTLDADSALLQPFLSDRARKSVRANLDKRAQQQDTAAQRNEILKVTTESPSRATVLTWEDKDSVLYILTNSGNEWFVDDRQQKCWSCSGTGKETDYEAWSRKSYSGYIPKKECTTCGGSGRISTYYRK